MIRAFVLAERGVTALERCATALERIASAIGDAPAEKEWRWTVANSLHFLMASFARDGETVVEALSRVSDQLEGAEGDHTLGSVLNRIYEAMP